MAKQEKQQTLAVEPVKAEATTYLGHRKDGKWTLWQVVLRSDGSLNKVHVLEHPDRRVAREQLRVLLAGKDVLP